MIGAIVRSFVSSVNDPDTLSGIMDAMIALGEALDSQPEKKKKRFFALLQKEVQTKIKRLARSHRLLRKEVVQLKKEVAELKRLSHIS